MTWGKKVKINNYSIFEPDYFRQPPFVSLIETREQFSLRIKRHPKADWFCSAFALLLNPSSQPMGNRTKINRELRRRVYPALRSGYLHPYQLPIVSSCKQRFSYSFQNVVVQVILGQKNITRFQSTRSKFYEYATENVRTGNMFSVSIDT